MALLRPCGRLVRAFSKLSVSSQMEYIRGVVCIARTQGYVMVAPKAAFSNNIEKLDLTNNNLSANEAVLIPRFKADLQRKLVSLCRSAKNGKIRTEDLLELLESSGNDTNNLDDTVSLDLLRNCGDKLLFVKIEDRRNLVKHIWELVSAKATTLSLAHYNTLLGVHVKNRQSVDPKNFIESMTVKPDDTTYKLLLKSAATNGDVKSALYVLSRMTDIGYDLNEEVFNLVIEAHSANKDIKSALSTLETMKKSRIEPSVETYARLAYGYAAIADIKNTMKILKEYPLGVQHIMEIVKRSSSSGLGKYIPDILNFMPTAISEDNPILMHTIEALIHSGYPEDAFEMMNCLVDVKCTHDANPLYEAFLKNMVYEKIPSSTIMQYANRILTENNYSMAIVDVCEAALRIGDRELAMAVFEVMHDKNIAIRPHYYWPLFLQASRLHGESDIFRILRHMLCLNVPVDHDTLYQNVLPHISTNDPLVTLRKLNDIGLEIFKIFTPLICYLLGQGRLKETMTICHKIRAPIDYSKVIKPLISAYKHSRNVLDCAKMFKFAPPNDHYPDELLVNIFGKNPSARDLPVLNNFRRVFNNLGIPLLNLNKNVSQEKNENTNESDVTQLVGPSEFVRPSRIPHPNEMNIEELECHLIELKSKGMNERGILRKLLQLHCQASNVKRVEEIRKEFEENGYPWTAGMYSSLLQFYAQKGRPEEALRLYYHLQKNYNDFKIDDFKVLLLANSLVTANHISDAIELLESNRSNGGTRISRDCWRLLNTVVHGPSSDLTESILDILVNSGFCEKNNATLGPLVREHLLKNDFETAVDTFRKCAERYGHTPLRQELINALVMSMSKDKTTKNRLVKLLEEVQNIASKINGRGPVKIDILIALARNEITDELYRFLKEHQISEQALIRGVKHIPEETKVAIFMTILDTITQESSLDRVLLSEYTLSLCSRWGDCQQAVELWKKMFANNIVASQKFRKQFVNLLEKHKFPLPEEFGKHREV